MWFVFCLGLNFLRSETLISASSVLAAIRLCGGLEMNGGERAGLSSEFDMSGIFGMGCKLGEKMQSENS